ncbi:MAG: hypothetical protein JSR37_09290 [Verrucomicrobia bacterium]|nr:hypothetical protein [Verrucomicrobiota bacterium]MBS0636339.1 hypothetical protein [Verrucomicrobiota bacterium]
MPTHEVSMLGEHYLHDIACGKKKYEGRVYSEKYRAMQVGDIVKFYEKTAGWGIECKITSMHPFRSFREMLEQLGPRTMLPRLDSSHSDEALIDEALATYTAFPGSERAESLGCVAIGVTFIKKYR